MAVTEVSTQSWGGRLIESIKGVLFGILIFLISFPLLFWNEGRAVKRAQDISDGASAVVSIAADSVDAGNDGKLVHLTGEALTDETLQDPHLGISAKALRLRRVVEMYQWEEHEKKKKKKNLGGSETTVTTYTYEMVWHEGRLDSGDYAEEGHDNPTPTIDSDTIDAKKVTVGAHNLTPALISQIDAFEAIAPDDKVAANIKLGGQAAKVAGDVYYVGADPSAPAIGDLRIRVEQVEPTTVSLIGAQAGDSFSDWKTPNGRMLEQRLEIGTKSADEMFQQLTAENNMMTWILRGIGFFMNFLGIFLVLRPLVVVADVVPLIGSLIEGGAFLISMGLAIPFSLVTIAVGWIAYRPLLGIGLLLAAGAVLAGVIMLKRKKKE